MGGIRLPSVNATTHKQAHQASMHQLGKVLPRLIAAMAAALPDHGPIFFAKWDIKDGFWRMLASEHDAWNFAYVLPAKPGEPVQLVIPTSLQWGGVSPRHFSVVQRKQHKTSLNNGSTTPRPSYPNTPWNTYAFPHRMCCPKSTLTGSPNWYNYWKFMLMILLGSSKPPPLNSSNTSLEPSSMPSTECFPQHKSRTSPMMNPWP